MDDFEKVIKVMECAGIADRRLIGMCCDTCRYKLKLEKLDYSQGGCKHTVMDGYVCVALASEGWAMWMYGENPITAKCEEYEAKEK